MNVRNLLPYFYLAVAVFLLISAVNRYLGPDLERYRILFKFYTEDKNIYILVRILLVIFIAFAGISGLYKNRKSS